MGILDLQGAVEGVFAHGLVAFALNSNMFIIGPDALPQGLGLGIAQRRGVGGKRVQQHLHFHFLVAVVGEGEAGIGKVKAVTLLEVLDPHQRADVPVGNVVRAFEAGEIVVLYHHELLAAGKLLLAVEDLTTDAQVIPAGPLVGAAQHHHFVLAVSAIGIGQSLQKLTAGEALDIGKTLALKAQGSPRKRQQRAKMRGVHKDARALGLPHHRRERHERHTPEGGHVVPRQRRGSVQPHGRQLRVIPHENQFAVHAGADERYQIGQQIPRPERRPLRRRDADERHLVYDVERVAGLVRRERERAHTVGPERFLPVNVLVDGRGRMPRIERQHFGRAAGGRQQDRSQRQVFKACHHRRHGRCLARSGIAVHYQDIAVVGAQKGRHLLEQRPLTGRSLVRKMRAESVVK